MSNDYFYSPTVIYSYKIAPDWFNRKCKNSEHSDGFDEEGFDEFGFDRNGYDRAWKRESEYKADKHLIEEIKQDYQFLILTNSYF